MKLTKKLTIFLASLFLDVYKRQKPSLPIWNMPKLPLQAKKAPSSLHNDTKETAAQQTGLFKYQVFAHAAVFYSIFLSFFL